MPKKSFAARHRLHTFSFHPQLQDAFFYHEHSFLVRIITRNKLDRVILYAPAPSPRPQKCLSHVLQYLAPSPPSALLQLLDYLLNAAYRSKVSVYKIHQLHQREKQQNLNLSTSLPLRFTISLGNITSRIAPSPPIPSPPPSPSRKRAFSLTQPQNSTP